MPRCTHNAMGIPGKRDNCKSPDSRVLEKKPIFINFYLLVAKNQKKSSTCTFLTFFASPSFFKKTFVGLFSVVLHAACSASSFAQNKIYKVNLTQNIIMEGLELAFIFTMFDKVSEKLCFLCVKIQTLTFRTVSAKGNIFFHTSYIFVLSFLILHSHLLYILCAMRHIRKLYDRLLWLCFCLLFSYAAVWV